MGYNKPAAYEKNRFPHVLYVCLLVLAILPGTLVAIPGDDVKKLLAEATDQRRAGMFDEAETTLRNAIAVDPTRNEAKIELAYILTKQRKLLDAYNLILPIAQADVKNS